MSYKDLRHFTLLVVTMITILPVVALGTQDGPATDPAYLVPTTIPICEAEDKQGELEIFDGTSSARRDFRDKSGRLCKTILYRQHTGAPTTEQFQSGVDNPEPAAMSATPVKPPADESEFTPYEVVIHRQWKDNRLQADCYYAYPDKDKLKHDHLTLAKVLVAAYDADGNVASQTWLRYNGTRSYRILFNGNGGVSHIYYDNSGRNVVMIGGQIPDERDMPTGWGESVDGLSCRIGIEETTATAEMAYIRVTIKNESAEDCELITAPFRLRNWEPELRDTDGNLIPVDEAHLAKLEKLSSVGKNGLPGSDITVDPNSAHNEKFCLANYYPNIPPGDYKLRVLRLIPGHKLVSNSISLRIVDKRPADPVLPEFIDIARVL